MGLPRGHTIPLSPPRRLMCDLLHFSRRVPLVAIERQFRLPALVAARQAADPRPSWFTLFLKAYAVVCGRRPELRRSYLSFPRPRLFQHPCTVASLAVAREVDGEDAVLVYHIRRPEGLSLAAIDERIRRARTAPVEDVGTYRRQLRLARLPGPVRRAVWWGGLNVSGDWRARYAGTFGVTGVAALGAASLHTLSPLTTTLTYGVFAADGTVPVRLFYDHRVLDGVRPAEALGEMEKVLNGPIAEELYSGIVRAA